MTEKKDRRCPNCTRYNVNCREPNRVTPKYATEYCGTEVEFVER